MRKKLMGILSVLVMVIFFSCSALASQIELDSMTDEEIITLSQEIQKQIVGRNINKTAHVAPGNYLVGRDIPAGSYSVKNNNTDDEHSAYIAIYVDEEKSDMLSGDNMYIGDEKIVSLTEGTLFQVRHQALDVTVFTGVVFE